MIIPTHATLPSNMRHPAWRWNMAMAYTLVPRLEKLYTIPDKMLHSVVVFSRNLTNCKFNPDIMNAKYPAMFEAFLIFNQGNTPCGLRWFLEAFLMTESDFPEIAAHFPLRLGAETVQAYKTMFFDIDEYLDNRIYVMSNILSACVMMPNGPNDYER